MIRYSALVQLVNYLAREFNYDAYRYYRMFGISRWTAFKAAVSLSLLTPKEIMMMAETFNKRADIFMQIAKETIASIHSSQED